MKPTDDPATWARGRNPLYWMVLGAILGPLLMLLLSLLHADPYLRDGHVLLFVTLTGAFGAWVAFMINPFHRAHNRSLFMLLATLIYAGAVFAGYLVAHMAFPEH